MQGKRKRVLRRHGVASSGPSEGPINFFYPIELWYIYKNTVGNLNYT